MDKNIKRIKKQSLNVYQNLPFHIILDEIFPFVKSFDDLTELPLMFGVYKLDPTKKRFQCTKTLSVRLADLINTKFDFPPSTKVVKIDFRHFVQQGKVEKYFEYIRWVKKNPTIVQYLKNNRFNKELLASFKKQYPSVKNHQKKIQNVFRLINSQIEEVEFVNVNPNMMTMIQFIKDKINLVITYKGKVTHIVPQNVLYPRLKKFTLINVGREPLYDVLQHYKLPDVDILKGEFKFDVVSGSDRLFSENVFTELKIVASFQSKGRNPFQFYNLKVDKLRSLKLHEKTGIQVFPQVLGIPKIKKLPKLVELSLKNMSIVAEQIGNGVFSKLKKLYLDSVVGVFDFKSVLNSNVQLQKLSISNDSMKTVNLQVQSDDSLTLLNFDLVTKISHLELEKTVLNFTKNKIVQIQRLTYIDYHDLVNPLVIQARKGLKHLALKNVVIDNVVDLQIEQVEGWVIDKIEFNSVNVMSNTVHKVMDKLFNHVKDLKMTSVGFYEKVVGAPTIFHIIHQRKNIVPLVINSKDHLENLELVDCGTVVLNLSNPVPESIKLAECKFTQQVLDKNLFVKAKRITLKELSFSGKGSLSITIDNKNLEELKIDGNKRDESQGIKKNKLDLSLIHPFQGNLSLNRITFYSETKKIAKNLMDKLFNNATTIHVVDVEVEYLNENEYKKLPLAINHQRVLQKLFIQFEDIECAVKRLWCKHPVQQLVYLNGMTFVGDQYFSKNLFDNAKEITLLWLTPDFDAEPDIQLLIDNPKLKKITLDKVQFYVTWLQPFYGEMDIESCHFVLGDDLSKRLRSMKNMFDTAHSITMRDTKFYAGDYDEIITFVIHRTNERLPLTKLYVHGEIKFWLMSNNFSQIKRISLSVQKGMFVLGKDKDDMFVPGKDKYGTFASVPQQGFVATGRYVQKFFESLQSHPKN